METVMTLPFYWWSKGHSSRGDQTVAQSSSVRHALPLKGAMLSMIIAARPPRPPPAPPHPPPAHNTHKNFHTEWQYQGGEVTLALGHLGLLLALTSTSSAT